MAELGWDAPLTRVLTPSGQRLQTLRQAGAYLSSRFGNTIKNAALEHAIQLLMHAAETGKLEDRKRATDPNSRGCYPANDETPPASPRLLRGRASELRS